MIGFDVLITATPNEEYEFVGWYLNGELYSEYASIGVTITAEKQVFEARFEQIVE